MSKVRFESCHKCKPPKRCPGCHSYCPDYIADKAADEEEKKKMEVEKEKEAFLNYIERKRDLRLSKKNRR